MELGKGRIRKVGINNLFSAVHPQHGVVWTDGKAIYLAPIKLQGNQLQNATSTKLGEFEYVRSIHWSRDIRSEFCYLCVTHQQNVTVWKVSGAQPKLHFKQVRKINVKPIPQGCLWNPVSDLLCLISKQQCSFYYRHDQEKGSFGFPPLESQISCGCWSSDGNKLVLCVGAVLLIYRWSDITKSIDKFAAISWKIPGLEGHVVSISPVMKDSLVVAAEIPMETLFKQQDIHKMPDIIGEALTRDDIIQPKMSVASTLFNLQLNEVGAQTGSSLSLINLMDGSGEPECMSTVPLKGVLSPDIIFFEKHSQCVVVGSNTQSQLHIFVLLDNHLAYCGDIQLEKSQRPKGLCSMSTYIDAHGAALLILVGQREMNEAGFLSPFLEADYNLSLKYIILKADYERGKKKGNRTSSKSKSSPGIVKADSLRDQSLIKEPKGIQRSKSMKNEQSPLETDIKLLQSVREDNAILGMTHLSLPQQGEQKEKMIEELSNRLEDPNVDSLEVQTVDFSSHTPCFNNSKLQSHYELSQQDEIREKTLHVSSTVDRESEVELKNCDREARIETGEVTLNQIDNVAKNTVLNSMVDELDSKIMENHVCLSTKTEPSIIKERYETEKLQDITPSYKSDSDTCNSSWIHNQSCSSNLPENISSNALEAKTIIDDSVDISTVIKSEHTNKNMKENATHSKSGVFKSELEDSLDSGLEDIAQHIKVQNDCLVALHERLQNMAQSVEDCSPLILAKHQEIDLIESIEIFCEKPSGVEKKTFLLDSGRLHLETVKLAFGLATVELDLGVSSCVLCANVDGFIPLKFAPHSQIKIKGQLMKNS